MRDLDSTPRDDLTPRWRLRRPFAAASIGTVTLILGALWTSVLTAQAAASRAVPREEVTIRSKAPGGARFQIVRGALVLPDSRIAFLALADGVWELCVFSATGTRIWSTPLRTAGTATSLAVVADTFAVLHHNPAGVVIAKYVQGRSEPVREERHPGEAQNVYALIPSTSAPLLVLTTTGGSAVIPRYELRRADAAVGEPPLLSIAQPGPHVAIAAGRGGSRFVAAPWAPLVSFSVGRGEILVSVGQAPAVEVYDFRGARTRTINLAVTATRMTDVLRDEWLAAWRAGAGSGLPDSTERLLRATRLPATRPVVRSVHSGLTGEIAIVRDDIAGLRGLGDSTYVDVFSPTGTPAISIVLEPGALFRGLGAGGMALVTKTDRATPIVGSEGRSIPSVYLAVVRLGPSPGNR